MSNYRKAVEQAVEPRPVIQCAHTGCMQPAITKDRLGANICRTHWDHTYRLEVAAEMRRLDLKTKDEKRYAIAKMAAEFGTKPPSKDWAYKLIERAKTEKVADYALKMARDIVERDRKPVEHKEAA